MKSPNGMRRQIHRYANLSRSLAVPDESPKRDRENWEFRFKACSAVSALASALSIMIGGAIGIYTYSEKTKSAEELKLKELRLIEYNQKREVFYLLVDAAASVANSRSLAEATANGQKYSNLYFGKAHIFAIDQEVALAKISFNEAMKVALAKGVFPSPELQREALELSTACKNVLRTKPIFSLPDSAPSLSVGVPKASN